MRQSPFICLSILLLWTITDSDAALSNLVLVAVNPVATTQVEVSFTAPETAMYTIAYEMKDCDMFSLDTAATMVVSGQVNVTATVPITTGGAGQDVSAVIKNTTASGTYMFAIACGKSYYNAPPMSTVDGLVDTKGLLAVEITSGVPASGITRCEVDYRLEGSSTIITVFAGQPPPLNLNITGLTSNLAYQIRSRCGVDGPSGQVSYSPYTDWKLVLAAPLPASICNGQQPVGMSVVTIAVLLVCAVLARHIPELNL